MLLNFPHFTNERFVITENTSWPNLASGNFWVCWGPECKGKHVRFMLRSWRDGTSKTKATRIWKLRVILSWGQRRGGRSGVVDKKLQEHLP